MARTKDPALAAQRKAQVIEAVTSLLEEGTWRGVSLSSVAAHAGVSKGVVTYWFQNKDALLLAAIRAHHDAYSARLAPLMLADKSTREKLIDLLEMVFPDRDTIVRELAFQAEVWSYAKEHPDLESELTQAYSGFRLACEALLMVGQQEGYVTASHTSTLYLFIHSLLDGLSVRVAFDPTVDVPTMREQTLVLLERWLQDAPTSG